MFRTCRRFHHILVHEDCPLIPIKHEHPTQALTLCRTLYSHEHSLAQLCILWEPLVRVVEPNRSASRRFALLYAPTGHPFRPHSMTLQQLEMESESEIASASQSEGALVAWLVSVCTPNASRLNTSSLTGSVASFPCASLELFSVCLHFQMYTLISMCTYSVPVSRSCIESSTNLPRASVRAKSAV